MIWGPDDWDAWTLEGAPSSPGVPGVLHLLRQTLEKIPRRRRKTVVDLGCGCGELVPFLAERFASVVAIDYAPATLSKARGNASAPNVRFRRRDLRDLKPFRGAFHVAVAIDSVVGPTTVDVDRVLRQVLRSLVEGGLLLATFPAAPRTGRPVAMKLATDPGPPGMLEFQEMELQFRLRQAGFQGVRIRRFDPDGDRGASLLALAVRRACN